MIASMEGKLQQLASQLTDQVTMYKDLEAKYHRAEDAAPEPRRSRSTRNEAAATEAAA